MDIGCARPREGSVTYGLYKMGWSGIVIDARNELRGEWSKLRPRDLAVFYPLTAKSGQYYLERADYRTRILKKDDNKLERISTMGVNEFVELYKKQFQNDPKVVKIDVEGLELEIVTELLNQKINCDLFIVEVVDQVGSNFHLREESAQIISVLKMHGYNLTLNDGINLWFVSNSFIIDKQNIWAPPYPGSQEKFIPSHLTMLNQLKSTIIKKLRVTFRALIS